MPPDITNRLSGNYVAWVGTQTVWHTSVRSDRDIRHLVENAKPHQISIAEADASGGAFTQADIVWNLPAAKAFNDPKVGDLLTERDGEETVWTILQVDRSSQRNRWRCTCRDLFLSADLVDQIEIWSPTGREDAAGSLVGQFLPRHMGVQAKVQEVRADPASELGVTGSAQEFLVYVGQRLYVTSDDQLRVASGQWKGEVLEVVSHEGADQLDRLQTITCRKGMW